MRDKSVKLIAALTTAIGIILLVSSGIEAQTEFMPVEDIEVGMRGVVKTSFKGTELEEVEAEVLGILPNTLGPKFDIIIVKLYGERVEFQGVANGMSGSPFYINGKLVGALAYRLGNFPKEPIGGVTPIQNIIDTQYGGQSAPNLVMDYHALFSGSPVFTGLADRLGIDPDSFRDKPARKSRSELQPLLLSMTHSGLHPDLVNKFSESFVTSAFSPVIAGSRETGKPVQSPLEPGMPVSVLLMTGDLSVGASGTVTHIDGNRLWAFGHPFYQLGSVNYPLARAEVITVLTSLMGSNNLIRTGEVIGALLQDRTAAVYGEIGTSADTFDMTLKVTYGSKDVGTYNFSIVRDNMLAPALVAIAVNNTLLVSQLQQGELAATIRGKMVLDGHRDIEFENFFSGYTIINDLAVLPATIYLFLATNDITPVRFESVELEIDVMEELKTATLERAWLTKTDVKPGDRFQLLMELRPRRGKPVIYRENFYIPPTLQSGTYRITVGNGAAINQQENDMVQGQIKLMDLDQMIRLINSLRANNRLYAQTYREEAGVYFEGDLFPSLPPSALSVMRENKGDENFVALTGTVMDERRIETDYMVSGVKKLTFTVKR
jgi:hypothetical protein